MIWRKKQEVSFVYKTEYYFNLYLISPAGQIIVAIWSTNQYINIYILDFVDRKELLEKEGNVLDIMCHYCDFRNNCHSPMPEEQWFELFYEDECKEALV